MILFCMKHTTYRNKNCGHTVDFLNTKPCWHEMKPVDFKGLIYKDEWMKLPLNTSLFLVQKYHMYNKLHIPAQVLQHQDLCTGMRVSKAWW
jgi:hypothetical protein